MATEDPRVAARRLVEDLLESAPSTLPYSYVDDGVEEKSEWLLLRPPDLDAEQVGYAFGPDGSSYVGDEPGEWRAQWLVIGHEGLLGDPLFVDLDEPSLPVFTAMHGMDRWDANKLNESLEAFLAVPSGPA